MSTTPSMRVTKNTPVMFVWTVGQMSNVVKWARVKLVIEKKTHHVDSGYVGVLIRRFGFVCALIGYVNEGVGCMIV